MTVRTFSIAPIEIWRSFSLNGQFASLSLALGIASMLAIGGWVSQRLKENILLRSSDVAAVYISDIVSTLVQELATTGQISAENIDHLDMLLVTGALQQRIVAVKVWSEDGTILYSSDPALVNQRFPLNDHVAAALKGETSSQLHELSEERSDESRDYRSLLEVYAPIYSKNNGEVIAVAEFHEDASELENSMAIVKRDTWIFTLFVFSCVALGYASVVQSASRTIKIREDQLFRRIAEISQAMSREKTLCDQIEREARKNVGENGRLLWNLGADLHDGPIQLIGLALLKLDPKNGGMDDADLLQARSAIEQAMQEMRAIIVGLPRPDIKGRKLADCIRETVKNHELRTGTTVRLACAQLSRDVPDAINICACRFIQEGLANAFRHAHGVGQSVQVEGTTDFIRVTVTDSGPGMPASYLGENGQHLGLISLRDRIERLNGTMTISSQPQQGTQLVAWLPLGRKGSNAVQC